MSKLNSGVCRAVVRRCDGRASERIDTCLGVAIGIAKQGGVGRAGHGDDRRIEVFDRDGLRMGARVVASISSQPASLQCAAAIGRV